MKKRFVCVLLATCLLNGCSPVPENSTTTISSTDETKIEATVKNTESEIVDIVYPETNKNGTKFEEVSKKELSNIPDVDVLTDYINATLKTIGVTDPHNIVWGNYHDSGNDLVLDMRLSADGHKLIISSFYISFLSKPEWTISSIVDLETGVYYYASGSMKNTVDLYDYRTGKIISEKSETTKDVLEKIKKEQQEADDKFEKSMDDLGKKYGLPKPEKEAEVSDPDSTNNDNTNDTSKANDKYVNNIYFWINQNHEYVAYEITNPLEYPIYFKMDTVFNKKEGEAIGTADDYVRCVGPGESTLLYSFNESIFDSITYTKDVREKSGLTSAQSCMTYSVTLTDNKQTFTVNNTSSSEISYAQMTVLYFKNNKPISAYDSYIGDLATIKAGKTEYEEVYTPSDYDTYKVYFDGYIEN